MLRQLRASGLRGWLALGLLATLIVVVIGAYFASQAGWFRRPLAQEQAIILEGTIVTPDTVIQHGWVVITDGRIQAVTADQPEVPADAVEIDAQGIIFPGLIDVHNHLSWNILARWQPPRTYQNRAQWREDEAYLQAINPYTTLSQGTIFTESRNRCALNAYGEVRALVGGVTAMMATQTDDACIGGLVRNLDYLSDFYALPESDRDHVRTVVFPTSDFIPSAQADLEQPIFEAMIVHAAEGRRGDEESLAEFSLLAENGLLTPKTVIVHGTALGPEQFAQMAAAGSSLVWSPRSNIVLYGETTDVAEAFDAGIQVALAPDWAVTGSSNMLDELDCAADWNEAQSVGLSDVDLVRMVTVIPAELAGINDYVGSVQEGLYADLLVIAGDTANPYRALIEARPRDVQLVLVGGIPVYGAHELMGQYWADASLDSLAIDGVARDIIMMPNGSTFTRLSEDLLSWLGSDALAPLVEDRSLIPPCEVSAR